LKKKKIPFEFVIENLLPLDPVVKPMFGCHAIYIAERIIFILRDRPKHPEDNGVWLATSIEYHESLKGEFPSMRSITVFGPGATKWQVLPLEDDNFETEVNKACDLVLKGDERIGKIPNS